MIEFRGVGMARGGVSILRDVSFRAAAGEVFAVLGPSGAGKSSLLRLACRLEDPDSGTILLAGADVRSLDVLSLRRRVSILFQEPVLFGRTVREDLEFAADPLGRVRSLDDGGSHLERVGLPAEFLDREPDSLSVGQRQRVALARALVPGPEVLLLDEPTSALDPQATSGILRLIRELRDRSDLAVVFVAHVVAHAREVADRVLVLKDGEVLEAGDAGLLDAPDRAETRAFLEGEEE
jgi:putative ABC transport system ATP-binding protein